MDSQTISIMAMTRAVQWCTQVDYGTTINAVVDLLSLARKLCHSEKGLIYKPLVNGKHYKVLYICIYLQENDRR